MEILGEMRKRAQEFVRADGIFLTNDRLNELAVKADLPYLQLHQRCEPRTKNFPVSLYRETSGSSRFRDSVSAPSHCACIRYATNCLRSAALSSTILIVPSTKATMRSAIVSTKAMS